MKLEAFEIAAIVIIVTVLALLPFIASASGMCPGGGNYVPGKGCTYHVQRDTCGWPMRGQTWCYRTTGNGQ